MWTEAHGIHKSYLKVVEEKMVALLFTEACEMFLLSLDSEIVSLGDFRDQGINDFIMKHKSFFKMRLAISGFRFSFRKRSTRFITGKPRQMNPSSASTSRISRMRSPPGFKRELYMEAALDVPVAAQHQQRFVG